MKELNLPQNQTELFEKYYEMLTEWNGRFNLTSVTARDEVIRKHFLDSIQGKDFLVESAAVCDVGSGAGFPRVPLKIVREDISLTLMDSVGKKVLFLSELTKELGLTAECVKIRAEDAARGSRREAFDAVTSRAVAPLNILLEYCLPLVKKGGVFLAYKTNSAEEIKKSLNALKLLGGKVREIKDYSLGEGENRQIIVIEKISPTPKAYPRGLGKERKQPL